MKITRKFLALMLAISFVISAISFSVFADAIESPIIPIGPVPTEWYQYEYDTTNKTAVLTAFVPADGRLSVTVRSTVQKDGETYAVVGVAADAFKGTNIKSATISEGVTSIGAGAFANCSALATVSIAGTVTDIAPDAFDNTPWLNNQPDGVLFAGKVAYKVKGTCPENVTLPADTAAISAEAFKGQTSLTKIIIPENTKVGADAFAGCTDLTIYCYENSPAHQYATANGVDFLLIPSLVLKTAPTKLEYYQNDALDFTGAELIYISEAGETPVEISAAMVTGYDAATLGEQTVTITYEGKTVEFKVTVIERPAYILGDVNGDGVKDIDDAIHLLFNINFEDLYHINQPADFDGSGTKDIDDAIYLLFNINFGANYPLH